MTMYIVVAVVGLLYVLSLLIGACCVCDCRTLEAAGCSQFTDSGFQALTRV